MDLCDKKPFHTRNKHESQGNACFIEVSLFLISTVLAELFTVCFVVLFCVMKDKAGGFCCFVIYVALVET